MSFPGCSSTYVTEIMIGPGCLLSTAWSAKLSGMIKHAKQMCPDDIPAVACVLDGLTSPTPHLAVFCFSTESFYFDCRLKLVSDNILRRAMADQSEFDNCQSSLKNDPDARTITVTDGVWLRFESRNLGQAIYTFFDNPPSADISVYRPFLQLSRSTQDVKDGSVPWHRTTTAECRVLPQDTRDGVATRFKTLAVDELDMLKEALSS